MTVREYASQFLDHSIHLPTRTIYLAGDPEEMHEIVIKGLHLMQAESDQPIKIHLHSFGGDWYAGIGVYDVIKASKCHITIHVHGCAMSMGSIMLQAGDTRIMSPHATLMIHDGQEAMHDTPSNNDVWSAHSKKIRKQMYTIYAERSDKPITYWNRRCKKDAVFIPEEALKLGLIDKIAG